MSDFQCHRDGSVNSCSFCSRPFGLIRYYSWQTPLCSKKCVERFKQHQSVDRSWLFRIASVDEGRPSATSR
jgi:hypothetical protein